MGFEINDKVLIITIITAIVLSLGGTLTVLTKFSGLMDKGPITGMAQTGTGAVNISILLEANIEIDANNQTIDFGTCSAPVGATRSINSSMNETELNETIDMINCSFSNLPAYIRIINIGNADVVLKVESDMVANGSATVDSLLSSPNARMHFTARNVSGKGCVENLTDDWSLIEHNETLYDVCDYMEAGGTPLPSLKFFMNLTIPSDASTDNVEKMSTLTFHASIVGE